MARKNYGNKNEAKFAERNGAEFGKCASNDSEAESDNSLFMFAIIFLFFSFIAVSTIIYICVCVRNSKVLIKYKTHG